MQKNGSIKTAILASLALLFMMTICACTRNNNTNGDFSNIRFKGVRRHAKTTVEGRVMGYEGEYIKDAEIRFVLINDDGKTNVMYTAKSKNMGRFEATIEKERFYLVYVNHKDYDPYWKVVSHATTKNILKIRMRKYAVPLPAESVELVIDGKSYPMANSNDKKWTTNISLKKGKYAYGFRINNESYLYRDLSKTNFEYNGWGDYGNVIITDSFTNMSFTFDLSLYRRVHTKLLKHKYFTKEGKYRHPEWFIQKYWLEKTATKSQDASEFVLDKVQNHKIVFFGEHHTTGNPIVFLAENIEMLYKKGGVRYIFLESLIPSLDVRTNIGKLTINQWQTPVSWKYLFRKVYRINSTVAENEKIRLMYAEEGLKIIAATEPNSSAKTIMRKRDAIAFSNVMRVVTNSRKRDKIIIFYGSAHGIKRKVTKRMGGEEFLHYPVGARLFDEIGKDKYYAINFNSASTINYPIRYSTLLANQYFTEMDGKHKAYEIKNSYFDVNDRDNYKRSDFFDGMIAISEFNRVYPISRYKNRISIQFYINEIKKYYLLKKLGVTKNMDNMSFAFSSYYLKYHLGDNFNYSYWNPQLSLKETIIQIDKWYDNNKDSIISESEEIQKQKEKLFTKFIFFIRYSQIYWYLEDYLSYMSNDVYAAIFYYRNRKGEYSKHEINILDSISQHPNVGNIYELPKIYKNVGKQLKEQGDTKLGGKYLTMAKNLTNEEISPLMKDIKGAYIFKILPNSQLREILEFADVIVEYNGIKIESPTELEKVLISDTSKEIEIKYYKDGNPELQTVKIKGGKLGVEFFKIESFWDYQFRGE